MNYSSYFWRELKSNGFIIVDFKQGDVTGDGYIDNVYLVGKKPYGPTSPFVDNITLIVQDGKTCEFTKITLEVNGGYGPTIFLGDFTKNEVDDILISIDSGGSGGYAFYYIYSMMDNIPNRIFYFENFNEEYTYDVIYQDNYQVKVIEKNTGDTYTIDIKYKGDEYLSEIYNDDGILKEPIEGWVNPLGGLYPVDFRRDGSYELYATRSIAGRYNADGLGVVQVSLEWNGKEFEPFFETVGIFG